MDLRSPLAKAKGLGSVKEGAHHWWMQRLSALALIPLSLWFVCNVTRAADAPGGIMHFLYSPFHATAMILFITVAIYHGSLGMKVIYEDYVRCNCGRTFLIIATNFISIALATGAVLAVLQVHTSQAGYYKAHKNSAAYHHEKHEKREKRDPHKRRSPRGNPPAEQTSN